MQKLGATNSYLRTLREQFATLEQKAMKTYMAKQSDASEARQWVVVDATDMALGRLAAKVARVIQGNGEL